MNRLADRAVAAFGTALLPQEHGGPAAALLAERVDRYLTAMPATSRLAIQAGLLSMSAASYLTTGRSLARLSPQRRAQVLHRIAALNPDAGAAVEGLKVVMLLANGADSYAAELLSRAQHDVAARPDAPLHVTPSTECASVVTADAVVVGSGAGGAMAARTLARAGLDVVVLEEGRRWTVEEFRSTHPIDRYAGLYRGAGSTIALGRPPVVLPMGRAVGGTTVVNSGTCYRPPVAVQQRWRDEFGLELADPDRLTGHLDDVEHTLQVASTPRNIMGRNGNLLLDAAATLGWQAAPIPATPQAAKAVASARSAARTTRNSACTSTRCRRPARPGRGSSPRHAPNGSLLRTDAPAACGRDARTAPPSTCWPPPSWSQPAPPRHRYCCGAAALVGILGWAAISHCIPRHCWPDVSTTTSTPGAACCRARPCTNSTSPTEC